MSWLIFKPWLTGSGYTPDTGANEDHILEMLGEAGDVNFEISGLSKLKGSLMKPPQYPDCSERPLAALRLNLVSTLLHTITSLHPRP